MEKRIRRIRVDRDRAARIAIPASEKRKMDELLQSIANNELETERLKAERVEMEGTLLRMMQVYRKDHCSIPDATADIVTPVEIGRAHV